ncbi:MAG: PRC-barrel domain-containing protein [Rhodospirillales bacterium]
MTGATEQSSSRLIGSDRVEGIAVYDADGTAIGAVERFLIDRQTGKLSMSSCRSARFSTARRPTPFRGRG